MSVPGTPPSSVRSRRTSSASRRGSLALATQGYKIVVSIHPGNANTRKPWEPIQHPRFCLEEKAAGVVVREATYSMATRPSCAYPEERHFTWFSLVEPDEGLLPEQELLLLYVKGLEDAVGYSLDHQGRVYILCCAREGKITVLVFTPPSVDALIRTLIH